MQGPDVFDMAWRDDVIWPGQRRSPMASGYCPKPRMSVPGSLPSAFARRTMLVRLMLRSPRSTDET